MLRADDLSRHQLREDYERLKVQFQTKSQEVLLLKGKTHSQNDIIRGLRNELIEMEGKYREITWFNEAGLDSVEYEFEEMTDKEVKSPVIVESEEAWSTALFEINKVNCFDETQYVTKLRKAMENNGQLSGDLELFLMKRGLNFLFKGAMFMFNH